MSPRNRNLRRPPIVHKFDLTGLDGSPEKTARIMEQIRKKVEEIHQAEREQSNKSANPTSPSKLNDWPKSQKSEINLGKKNATKRRAAAKELDDVQPADSHDWDDSGVASMPWLLATELKNEKKATKPKYSRKAISLVGKLPNKEKNIKAKNGTPKSRRNISSTTRNVDPRNVVELEDSANGKRKYSEAEIAIIRVKRRKWLETRETDSQWIKCCHQNCGKWRLVFEYEDAAEVPEIWYCSMNRDPDFASCDVPEEMIPKKVRFEMIESPYSIGSILWARLDGFPWWPAIVDECPELFKFCMLQGTATVPFKYHVVFIDIKNAFRAWVHVRNLKVYKKNPRELVVKKTKFRNIDYATDLDEACTLADEATSLTVCQRMKKFGWAARSAQKNVNKKKPSKKSRQLIDKYVLKDNGLTREQEIEREKTETRFKVGDIVWAQAFRYPWWPAMIDTCPILNTHIRVPKTRRELSMFYVVYFNDKQIEYDWISEEKVEEFSRLINTANLKQDTKHSNGNFKKQLEGSYKLAMEAKRMPLAKRLSKFGMSQRLEQQLLAYGNEAAWSVPEGSPRYYEDEEGTVESMEQTLPSVSVNGLSRCNSFGSFSTCTKKSWTSAGSTSSGRSHRRVSPFFFPRPCRSGTNDFRLRSRSNSEFSSISDDPTKLCGIPFDEILAASNDDY